MFIIPGSEGEGWISLLEFVSPASILPFLGALSCALVSPLVSGLLLFAFSRAAGVAAALSGFSVCLFMVSGFLVVLGATAGAS
ncbi:hypothetical protein D3C81_2118010 [compost metagenome]